MPPTRWPQQRLGYGGRVGKVKPGFKGWAQGSWDRWEQDAWGQVGMAHRALGSWLADVCETWLI